MLAIKRFNSSTSVPDAIFSDSIAKLQEKGWIPAIREANRRFNELAGISDDYHLGLSGTIRSRLVGATGDGSLGCLGDVFFAEGDIYFLVPPTKEQTLGNQFNVRFTLHHTQERLEFGLITDDPSKADERITYFVAQFISCVNEACEERKQVPVEIELKEILPTGKLQKLIADENAEAPNFKRVELNPDLLAGALLLSEPFLREVLLEIKKAGFVQQSDLFNRRLKQKDAYLSALIRMKEEGLLNSEYLVLCQEHGFPLIRIKDAAELSDFAKSSVSSVGCGCTFDKARAQEGYTVSAQGVELADSSHWMTVWFTSLLVEYGISLESIVWNVAESGDEIDVLFEHCNNLWVVELKDKEFEAGSAYPFRYRVSRYDADVACIVTSRTVAPNAKKVLREGARHDGFVGEARLVVVEGLDRAQSIIGQVLNKETVRYAESSLAGLTELSGYNLSGIVNRKFISSIGSHSETSVAQSQNGHLASAL